MEGNPQYGKEVIVQYLAEPNSWTGLSNNILRKVNFLPGYVSEVVHQWDIVLLCVLFTFAMSIIVSVKWDSLEV